MEQLIKASKEESFMFKNVFIFGAGADNNFYPKVPLGNEFVIKIFSNLGKVRKKIKSKKNNIYKFIYSNFKRQIYKKGNDYFFEWKSSINPILKSGIEKMDIDIFPESGKKVPFNLGNGQQILIVENHLRNVFESDDKKAKKFFIALLLNIGGSEIAKYQKENMINLFRNQLKEKLGLEGSNLNELFEDLEVPIYYEPEHVIVDYVKRILEEKIKNFENFSGVKELIYENYILKIFDYTVIFDELYDVILNCDLKNTSPAKVLRYLHFMLAMDFTIRELEDQYEKSYKNSKSYYEMVKSLKHDNHYFVNLNYTNFLKKTLGEIYVNHIHGKVGEYMILEDRKIINEEEVYNIKDKKIIPNFVPQSLLKPIISVEMIERYYKTYEALKSAERCIIVGFGLNRDDAHILNILQTALRFNKKLKIFIYTGEDIGNNSGYQILSRDNGNRIEVFDYKKCNFESFLNQIKIIG
ncbi:MAG: hypothetical protein PWP54_1027 [Thermosipho sp. (in: thermotogales)]|nr:hypothetical protein [Thermosipho sp. (in: thermotogales)]MDN5325106.1 hypothetical protein [Thermosipho sp. (in: thermotogales)]